MVGLAIILVLSVCALFPGKIAPYDYAAQQLRNKYKFPSAQHIMGTDEFGRDVFSRLVWGCRTSLSIGVSAIVIACVLGVAIGCIAGFYGDTVDNVLMRIIDILLAVPDNQRLAGD